MTSEEEVTRWRVVILGVAISAFGAFLQFKLPPVLPAFLAEFPHDAEVAAGFMSVFALVGLLASAPLGRLLDRRALIQALGAGLVFAALGILLGLIAPYSATAMLTARGAEGLTFAIFALIGPVIANRGAARRDLGLVTGLIAAWIPIGQLVAGLLALAGADWQALWLTNLALIPVLGLAGFLLRDNLGPRAITALPLPAATASSSALARQARPDRALVIGGGIFLLWSLQFFAFMTWLTKYLTGELGLAARAAILAYLLPVVVVMLFNVLTGWALARGLGLMKALVAALLLQGFVWLAAPHADGLFGVALLIAYGIGAGVAPACFFHLPHHLARGGVPVGARAYGVLMTGRNCGVFLGPIVMALLFQGALGWSGAALVIAGICAAAAGLALTLKLR
ncbi:putative MFS family arabinose efflux permease [Dongia mobilis]|uniref:Putative MFS family arabinose efflux permease n=1 Tax=Dongia mobilis TaxID=578943 RepID=A0A4R6WVX8_9PROT|nr:MFS transporter [Dongia mobilis]TDQ85415.1 putative MFS family arabinose efflux permease [Dongia mobilis]